MTTKKTAPTVFEQKILDTILKELRRAMRMKGQLTLIIDPWTSSGGASLFASPNVEGRSYEIPYIGEASEKPSPHGAREAHGARRAREARGGAKGRTKKRNP